MAQQMLNLGTVANDGTGDTLRDGGDKINDNFTELYAGLTGLLDFKGSTDCSANPNYPAASKGDFYLVSVAGKIGGASGIVVEVGDSYFATADNAGGTQAGVGTSWTVLQGNITAYLPLSGGTLTGDLVVPAEAYDATNWNGSNEVPTKNDVRDKIEAVIAGAATVTSWKDGVRAATTVAGTLATSFENGDTIDGVTLATGDRILIKNQAAPAENGIYVVAASGAPTRSTDADSGAEMVNATVKVSEGTTLADTEWECTTNAPITLNTTGLTFAQFAGGGSFTAASTTEVLTGTDTTKGATSDSIAALWEQGADVASSGTISIGEGGYFNITGTTTITDIDFGTDKAGRKAWVKFAGVLTLTHNASTLILPTGGNITTAAGDTACFVSEGSDVVRCVAYNRASGAALVSGSGSVVLIEEYIGDGTTGTKTFSSIPGTYRSLRLVWAARGSASATASLINIQFNGDTGANYDRQLTSAAATTTSPSEALAQTSAAIANISANTATAGAVGVGEANFPDYAGTTFHKGGVSHYTYKTGTATGNIFLRNIGIHWRSTAAITSLTAALDSGNFMTGSKLQLYGIT